MNRLLRKLTAVVSAAAVANVNITLDGVYIDVVQKNYGMHITNLNIAQIKKKHGIIERENNKPK